MATSELLTPGRRKLAFSVSAEAAVYLIAMLIVVLSFVHPGRLARQIDFGAGGLALILAAMAFPGWVPAAVAVGLVLIPGYALPTVGVLPGNPPALICLAAALALGLTVTRPRSRVLMTSIDWVVTAVLLLMLGAVLMHIRSVSEYAQDAVLWVSPFVAGRMMGVSPVARRRFAQAFVVAGIVLSPFVLVEAATHFNPFQKYLLHGSELMALGATHLRGGAVRASGSFGQPIALSMFLAVAILFAIALGLRSRRPVNARWYAAAALLVVCQLVTVSRTGWLMLAVGIIYAAVVMPNARARVVLRFTCVAVVCAAALVGQIGPTSISTGIPLVGRSTSETSASSSYRSGLLSVALNDNVLRPFGSVNSTLADRVVADYQSVDNEYLEMADRFGYVPALALFVLLPLMILLAALYFPRDVLDVMYVASSLAVLAAIATVAFITQQQVMVWLILGMTSGLYAARFGVDRGRTGASSSCH